MPAKQLTEILTKSGLSTAKAEDCAIININAEEYLLTNIDIFTAIHDDPYVMGQIAACNVTNDLFALNAVEITNYSNFMGLPTDIPENFAESIIKGIRDFLKPLGGDIHGGHTIYNPWPQFGGSASSIIKKGDIIRKQGAISGDILVLTKPLGVQPIMAAYRVMQTDPEWLVNFDMKIIKNGIKMAEKLMTTSNQPITKLIHKNQCVNKIHAMTDITGFGIKGHLQEMLQDTGLGAQVLSFPIIQGTLPLAELFGYQLQEGYSPEISGGMLMAVDSDYVDTFISDLSKNSIPSFIIGNVLDKPSSIQFSENFQIVEIGKF